MGDLKLEKGDLIFTKDTSLISKIIRYFTGGKSHVMVCYDPDKGMIYESNWDGVVITGLKRYLNTKTKATAVKLPKHIDRDKFIEILEKRIGDNYDYSLIFGQFISKIFSFLKLSKYDNHTKWLCYEIIGVSLEELGEKFDCDVIELDPQKLLNHYSKDNETWVLDVITNND